MIYISYFGNIKGIPEGVEVVSIARFSPKWLKDIREIQDLAPSSQLIWLWKNKKITWEEYCYIYVRDVLSQLRVENILKQIGNKDVCLCCYEPNGEHCHRYIVKAWLESKGIEVKEVQTSKKRGKVCGFDS